MGVDTDVLLRIRDRAALRDALEARAVRERKDWADQGREAAYDELVADGYDPRPRLRPLKDGNVSIFTGLRFHDHDMEYSIRCWLHANFGDALSLIHDDPRGVFVSPDVCEPRAKTYDGIIAELEGAGRFIDPSPPTQEEQDAHDKSFDDYVDEGVGEPADALAIMREIMELPEGAANDANDDPGSMFETMMEQGMARLRADPLGFGRVSMLLPAAVAKTLAANPPSGLDVQERRELADGSVVLVTSRMGDAVMEAATLAEALAATSIDRAALGTLPFFRESLADEASSKLTFEEATRALGDRVERLELRTWDERMQDDKKAVASWLENKDEP